MAVLWCSGKQTGGTATALVWAGIIVLIIAALLLAGLTPVVPGQARVIQLFGKYRGTIRDPGLQWVNPFTHRIKVSTRIRSHETAQAKVNDADGNPIEIAAVVVLWPSRCAGPLAGGLGQPGRCLSRFGLGTGTVAIVGCRPSAPPVGERASITAAAAAAGRAVTLFRG